METIFLLGAAGALAPEIIRLYNLRREGAGGFSLFYLAISLAFAGLGGLVAVILPSTTLLAAFYAGISTPVLISSGLRQAMRSGAGEIRHHPAGDQKAPPSLRRFIHGL